MQFWHRVFIWFFCRIILPSAWSSSFPIHPQCVIVWGLWWHVRDTPARPNNSSMCIFHQKTSTRPCESCKNPASSGINVLNWQCIRWDFLCSRSISFLENKQKGLEFGKVPSGYSFCLFLGLTLHKFMEEYFSSFIPKLLKWKKLKKFSLNIWC